MKWAEKEKSKQRFYNTGAVQFQAPEKCYPCARLERYSAQAVAN